METNHAERHTAGVLAPPPLIYLLPLLVGLWLDRRWPIGGLPPILARPLGALAGLGFLVTITALLAFRRARTRPEPWKPTTALVTDGPYRYTRNPMYLGFACLYLGVALWFGGYWTLGLLPAVLVVMTVGVIRREERYLERLFGEVYAAYRNRVRRWI